jgi:hypothetical protein
VLAILAKPNLGLVIYFAIIGTSKVHDIHIFKRGRPLFKSLFRDIANGDEPISQSHCDIIVSVDNVSSKVTVIGGNVQNSVTEKVLNLNERGVLSAAQGNSVCDRYNADKAMSREPSCNLNRQKWFVLLQAG